MEFLDKKIEDDGAYGTVEVQISPIGDFNGSSADGKPIPEHLTQDNLAKLADALNASDDEVLVDVDHKSTKSGNDKDTKAAGWLSRFVVDPIKGLFGKLRLTRHGRDLVDSREYRHLSPVFSLDEKGEPIKLMSVGMTNCPALDMNPILNSEPNQEIIKMEITKEELVQLIKDTVAAMNEAPTEEVKEEVKEETCEQKCEQTKEVENACGKKEVKNEEVVEEKTETTESPETKEEKKVEEEKKEVIKEEVLNSAPALDVAISAKPEWEGKHGKEFFDCLRKNGYRI